MQEKKCGDSNSCSCKPRNGCTQTTCKCTCFISLTTQAMDDSIILPEIPTDEENSDDGNVNEIDENFYIIAEEDDELEEDAEFEANCNEDTDDEFEEDEIQIQDNETGFDYAY